MDGGYVHSLRRARSLADTDNENEREPLLSPSCSCDSRKGHGVWGQSPQPPTNFMFYDSEISDAETNIATTAPNTSLIAPYNNNNANNNNNNRRVHFNKHRLYHKNTTDYYRQNIRRPLFRQSLNNIFNSPSKDRIHYDDLSLSRSENGYHLKLIPTGSTEDKLYFMTTTHKPAIGSADGNLNANANVHHMDQEEEKETSRPKQSSLVTIFSIWNTMMGTSLLAMPWGMQMSGLPAGIVIAIVMGAICFYTAYCNIDAHKQHGTIGGEVFELTRLLLGRTMERVAKLFSYIVLYGAVMVYWILMTNFMAFNVNYIYGVITGTEAVTSNVTAVLCPKYGVMESAVLNGTTDGGFFSVLTTPQPQPQAANPSLAPTLSSVLSNVLNSANATNSNGGDTDMFHTYWTLKTVPIYLVAIVGPLLFFKSPTFFTKFNSLGTMSVMYLILYVLVKSCLWGVNMTFTDTASEHYGVMVSSTFGAMSGMLSLSYFIHNIIISLMRNNRHQKNNARDLSIAYVLVMLTYTFIGATFYMAFPLRKSCIEDNILNNMMVNDPMTLLVRLFLFFQLVTVYPLITFMLRTQMMVQLFGTTYPSIKAITLFNSVILISCVLVAIFVPKIGMVIRFTGAFSGFIHVFTLPCLLRIASLRKRGELTLMSIIINTIVPLLGGVNILLQFFIDDA